MKTLIVGGSGFLGTELARQARAAGHQVTATYTTRPAAIPDVTWLRADLTVRGRATALLEDVSPDVVINAASRKSSWPLTAEMPIELAAAASRLGCHLVHVSSDAVFSGARPLHAETDLPDPVTAYGAAKAAAEAGITVIAPGATIARTSLILGDGDSVHEEFVHALAAGRAHGVLFTDVVRCPVHRADLAAALLQLADERRAGVRHVAGPEALTRHELGHLIATRDRLDTARLTAGLKGTGALQVRMTSTATQQLLDVRLRGAREFLATGQASGELSSMGRPSS